MAQARVFIWEWLTERRLAAFTRAVLIISTRDVLPWDDRVNARGLEAETFFASAKQSKILCSVGTGMATAARIGARGQSE